MTLPGLRSVRGRLAVAAGLVVGALLVIVAIAAPRITRQALLDEAVRADVDAAAARLSAGAAPPAADVSPARPVVDPTQLSALVVGELFPLIEGLAATDSYELLRGFSDDGSISVAIDARTGATISHDGRLSIFALDGATHPMITLDELDDLVFAHGVEPAFVTEPSFDAQAAFDEVFAELGAFDHDVDLSGFESVPELHIVATGDHPAATLAPTPELELASQTVNGVEYVVGVPMASIDRTVGRVRMALWWAVPAGIATAAAAAWLLAGLALRPVRVMANQANTISAGTLDRRVLRPRSRDELAGLADTINAMLERLDSDDRRRRRFVSDASHELRSPISSLRAQAEVTLRELAATPPSGAEPSGAASTLATGVLADSTRLAELVDDLLTLARSDERRSTSLTDVDLDDVVFEEAARAGRRPIDTSAVSGGRVRGNHDDLRRVVAHLLDNANRHARSTIAVSVTELTATADPADRPGMVRLAVDDDGPGVAPADREAVFERFVRLDDSRARDSGGAGLGLSVVAAIVEVHGGSYRVVDSQLGGARVEIDLPGAR